MECNDNNSKEINFGLLLNIILSENSNCFNKKKIIKDNNIQILLEKDFFLVLKKNHYSFAIFEDNLLKKQYETIIFKIEIKPDEIKLINFFDRCRNYSRYEKFYNSVNDLNFNLWKAIENCQNKNIINGKNKERYIYDLKENDIIRLGSAKLILREFNISNNSNKETENKNENNYINRQFTMKLNNNEGEICSICEENNSEPDNPIVKICKCEKYSHFKCLKKEIKKHIAIEKDNNNSEDCVRYLVGANCFYCKKFMHLTFIIENKKEIDKNNKYKLFELVDIPRNKNEDYLFFETIDFLDRQQSYIKYFYLIKLRKPEINKNIETIIIGNECSNDKYNNTYDKHIKIGNKSTVCKEHALIEYNPVEKSLVLTSPDKKFDTLILQNEVSLKTDYKPLFFDFGNLHLEAKLIKYDQTEFESIKSEMKNNSSIELRA